MRRVIKFDTSNTGPTRQIIIRMRQASISHYSAHKAWQPHNKSQSRYIVPQFVFIHSWSISWGSIVKFFHKVEKLFPIKKLDKIFLNFVIGPVFLISLSGLLKMSTPLWVKHSSNNLLLWPITNKSDLFLLLYE